MDDAARHFVDIFELQQAAGRKLAQLSGAESGMVTSGAAGAMAAATAGCMAGTDPNKVWQLPDTTGMKNEVVMLGGRSAFDSAIRLAGAKLVVVGSVDDLPSALNDRTAMVYTTWLGERLQQALAVTKKAGVPLMLDDAAGIPPIENLTVLRQHGHRPVLLFRRQGVVRAPVFGNSAWKEGPDRGGARAMQSMGRRRLPRDESRQGRDRRRAGGRRNVDEARPRRAQQAMVAARRAHRQTRGDRVRRHHEHHHPRGWQQLPDADRVVGSGGVRVHGCRLRPRVARRRAAHRGADIQQPELRACGLRGHAAGT